MGTASSSAHDEVVEKTFPTNIIIVFFYVTLGAFGVRANHTVGTLFVDTRDHAWHVGKDRDEKYL